MKILVFSDSHGNPSAMRRALAAHPDAATVIHLGDGATEAVRLCAEDTPRPWHIVRGNCDGDYRLPAKDIITLGGCTLYLTHGHTEHVKFSLLTLSCAAREASAHAALYGHTHIAATDFDNGVLLFNPGSIGTGSYGVLTVENGDIHSSHYRV